MRWRRSGPEMDEAVDQDEDGLREIDIEERFGRGEFEDAAVLEEAVEAFLAQVEEMIAEELWYRVCVGRDGEQRVPARAGRLRQHAVRRPGRRCRARRGCRSWGNRCGRRGRTAGAGNRSTPWRWRRWSAGCAWCSSGGWRWPGRCRRSRPHRAFPCAPGTGARRRRAIRRSGAGLRRRWCRRRARICRNRTRP